MLQPQDGVKVVELMDIAEKSNVYLGELRFMRTPELAISA